MYQLHLTWTRFQQKTSLINTIIFLRRNYKTISNASGQVGSTHHQPRYNRPSFYPCLRLEISKTDPADLLTLTWRTRLRRFNASNSSLTCPFCWNDFLFLLLYETTFFVLFVCACVFVWKQRQCLAKDGSISKLEPALFQRHNSSKVIPHSSFWVCPRRRDYTGLLPGVCFLIFCCYLFKSLMTCWMKLGRSLNLYSLAIGFLLSLLGSIVLFLGQLGSFAGEYTIVRHTRNGWMQ